MAAVTLPPVPNPPPQKVALIDTKTGKPTKAEYDYRIAVRDWQRAVKAAIEGAS